MLALDANTPYAQTMHIMIVLGQSCSGNWQIDGRHLVGNHTMKPLLYVQHSVHNGQAAHALCNMHMMITQAVKTLEDPIQVDDPVLVPPASILQYSV